MVSSVHFALDEWPGEPPRTLVEIARNYLDRDLPLIAFIDDRQ
jgi:hypothetical protein